MPVIRKEDIVKRAMTGLIGDNQKTVTADKLYKRVWDQCKRLGLYYPAWPVFVGAVRANGATIVARKRNGKTVFIVNLPRRGKLGRR